MTKSIEELKLRHLLAKPVMHQAILNIQHINKMQDGEKALLALGHCLDVIKSFDEVGDTLFVEIDKKKEELERSRQSAKHWQDRYDDTADKLIVQLTITELAVSGLQMVRHTSDSSAVRTYQRMEEISDKILAEIERLKSGKSEPSLNQIKMVAFNSYDDFSKYSAKKIVELYERNDALVDLIKALPEKLLQIDSWADTYELNFPIPDATEEDQNEWFERFCTMQGDYIHGVIKMILCCSYRLRGRAPNEKP